MTHATGYLKHGHSKSFELPIFNAIWKKEETRTVLAENKLSHECSIFLCQTGVQGTDGNLVGKSLTFCSTSLSFCKHLHGRFGRCRCQVHSGMSSISYHQTGFLRHHSCGCFSHVAWMMEGFTSVVTFHPAMGVFFCSAWALPSETYGLDPISCLVLGPYRREPMVWTLFCALVFEPHRREPMVWTLLCFVVWTLSSGPYGVDLTLRLGFVGTWLKPYCNLVLVGNWSRPYLDMVLRPDSCLDL